MKTILIILQSWFLGFILWELFSAKKLPEKYSKLKPMQIRAVDIALAALAIATIWYMATQ